MNIWIGVIETDEYPYFTCAGSSEEALEKQLLKRLEARHWDETLGEFPLSLNLYIHILEEEGAWDMVGVMNIIHEEVTIDEGI